MGVLKDSDYEYGQRKQVFTYGILPHTNYDHAYEYSAKVIYLQEKNGGFAKIPGDGWNYEVNYTIAILHDFFKEIYFIYVRTPNLRVSKYYNSGGEQQKTIIYLIEFHSNND